MGTKFVGLLGKTNSTILEFVLPSKTACSSVGIASQKFRRDYFSQFSWCPQKP